MEPGQTQRCVFISYARADGAMAARVVEERLIAAGFAVWRDVRAIDPSADFSVEIETAIAAARAVVLCVTPSLDRQDSFVRREILYAQAKQRRIIPIRLEQAAVPVLVAHLTYVEASVESEAGVTAMIQAIVQRLDDDRPRPETRHAVASRAEYLAELYDEIVAHLDETAHKLLDIAAIPADVETPVRRALPATFRSVVITSPSRGVPRGPIDAEFGVAFRRERQAVVLHGRAGSGKTTRLMIAARDAVLVCLEDPLQPVPLIARAADWSADADEPVEAWLGRSTTLLSAHEVHDGCARGHVVIFVDGLDELGPLRMHADGSAFDPRALLLSRLPENVPVLVTCRSEAMAAVMSRPRYRLAELQPLGEDQVRDYIADVPRLRELFDAQPALLDMARTPLNLGLLAVAVRWEAMTGAPAGNWAGPNAQFSIIKAFVEKRFEHERLNAAAAPALPLAAIECVLGRVATQQSGIFDLAAADAAGQPESMVGYEVVQHAVHLGYLIAMAGGSFRFLHPLFDDYFAYLHCHKYLGTQSDDGWDNRLFYRIARLGDSSFMTPLTAMADAPGFWPGEFGAQIALALEGISAQQPELEQQAVDAFVTLATRQHLEGADGIRAIAAFGRRASDSIRPRLVGALANMVTSRQAAALEAIAQLVQMGPQGIDALIGIVNRPDAPMRQTILSYTAVRARMNRPPDDA